MRYVAMGPQKVSVVGLGTWQFGEPGWGWGKELNQEEARRIVHRALELGINFFDTAEGYAGGQSEKVLGEALEGKRHEAVVATKMGTPLRPDRVKRAAVQSLRRLGIDYIDLYQLHAPDNSVPIAQTMEAMGELLDTGRVRQVGVSNFSLTQWKQAEAALGRPVISNQVEYHLLERRHGEYLLPHAGEQGRIIVAWSPLAQGLLGGKYGPDNLPYDLRTYFGIFSPENIRRAPAVVDVLREVGQRYGATPAQVALAWLLKDPQVIVIPGARSVAQLEANAAAADLQLSQEDVQRIGTVAELR